MEGDEIVDKRLMVSTGDYLMIATGLGENIREAQSHAYDVIDSVEIPNSIGYRTDIGDRLKSELPVLQDFGFFKDWSW